MATLLSQHNSLVDSKSYSQIDGAATEHQRNVFFQPWDASEQRQLDPMQPSGTVGAQYADPHTPAQRTTANMAAERGEGASPRADFLFLFYF